MKVKKSYYFIKKISPFIFLFWVFFLSCTTLVAITPPTNIIAIPNSAGAILENGESYVSNEVFLEVDFYQKKEDTPIINKKEVSRPIVRRGETFKYMINVSDPSGIEIVYYQIEDFIPYGMEFIDGTLKITEGYKAEVLHHQNGSYYMVVYPPETSTQLSEFDITYGVKVGPNAKSGKNMAEVRTIAYGIENYYISNTDSAVVEIVEDAFDLKGMIFGRVFLDLNENKIFDKEDIGVPGAKIYLENGDYAITDRDGKYSIYGENAITHVAKLDRYSIPDGAELYPLGLFYNKQGDSIFVPLKTEQAHKANFALKNGTSDFIEKIKERRKIFQQLSSEIESYLENVELRNDVDSGERIRTKPNGIIGGKQPHKFIDNYSSKNEAEENSILDREFQNQTKNLEKIDTANISNKLEFYNIKSGDVVDNIQNIQIKGKVDGNIDLYLNGKLIPKNRIGFEKKDIGNNIVFIEYVALQFQERKNILKAVFSDPFGNPREEKELEVISPGEFYDFKLELINGEEEKDSIGVVRVKLTTLDRHGVHLAHHIPGTIKSATGKILNLDKDSDREGIQFDTDSDGSLIFFYVPNENLRKAEFEINMHNKMKKISIPIKTRNRPLFINGLIEGRVNLKGLSLEEREQGNYLFENTLKSSKSYGDSTLSKRGAVFVKGNIAPNYYLTLSYDNGKEEKKFFGYRDSQDYFPIYGDDSIRGYEAQSISKIYARIDNENGYLMYGDYEINDWRNEELELSNYSRILNGWVGRMEYLGFEGGFFASKTSNREVIEKLRGEGVSGPYFLKNRYIIAGSEQIEIITYSRNNPSIVLNVEKFQRGFDYMIDYFTGRIFFTRPIRSTDYDFNPQYIQVSYEMEDGAGVEKTWLYGGDLTYDLTQNLSLGANFVKDDKEFEGFQLRGLNSKLNFLHNRLIFEAVETESYDNGTGRAYRIEYGYDGEKLKSETEYLNSDKQFYNPNAYIGKNIESIEHSSEYTVSEKLKLELEGIYLRDKNQLLEETNIFGGIKIPLSETMQGQAGVRYYSQDGISKNSRIEHEEFMSLAGRVIWNPKKYPMFSGFGEYEQNLSDADLKRVGVGAKYRIFDKMNLYINQEFLSDMGRDYTINPTDSGNKTLIGIETEYQIFGKHFTEYRLKKNGENIAPELASGIKRDFEPIENLKLYGTYERVQSLSKSGENESSNSGSNSIVIGYKYKIDESSYMNGDIEREFGDNDVRYFRLGYGKEISENLSFIFKNRYYSASGRNSESKYVLGVAYRDSRNDRFNNFFKYEYIEDDGVVEENYRRKVNLLKNSSNYSYSKSGILTLSLALKQVKDAYGNEEGKHFSYMAIAGVTQEIGAKIDIGLNGGILTDYTYDKMRYSLGAEIGYQLPKNIWISAGYNVSGFADRDFDPSGQNKRGPYIRFRMKLDENIFN